LLTGCVTAEERAQQMQQQMEQMRAAMAAADDNKCRSYGAQPGSEPYTQCRLQLDTARTQAMATVASAQLMRPPSTCVRSYNTVNCF
jgi:hypothetical protein